MLVPSRMKSWPPFGPTTRVARCWPYSISTPSSSTYTGRNARTSSNRCSAAMAVAVSSSTGFIACWPMIRTTSVAASSPTGSASPPVAFASATTFPWIFEPHLAVRAQRVVSMRHNHRPNRCRHQHRIPSEQPRRWCNVPFTSMPQINGIGLAMNTTSLRVSLEISSSE